MNGYLQVDTLNETICRALLDIGKQNGWQGSMFHKNEYPIHYHVLILETNSMLISGNNTKYDKYTTISIEEAIQVLQKSKAKTKEIIMVYNPNDTFQVNTLNETMCRAFLNLAKQHGWGGSIYKDVSYPIQYHILVLSPSSLSIGGNDRERESYITISIEKAIEILQQPMSQMMNFQIDGRPVKVFSEKVSVGCVDVSWSQVSAIYTTMMDLRG